MNKLKITLFLGAYNLILWLFFLVNLFCYMLGRKNRLIANILVFIKVVKKNVSNNQKFIWLHASSVGEGLQSFCIVKEILLKNPQAKILVTSHTLTAEKTWREEFKNQIVHHYLPLDLKFLVKKFLNFYQPYLVLWVESDFWFNYLQEIRKRNIPAFLLNGRLSKRSFKRWRLVKTVFGFMLNNFKEIFADSVISKERFSYFMPAKKVHYYGNLKYARNLPELLPSEKNFWEHALAERTVLVALSTHPKEEEMIAAIHKKLKKEFPSLLTVVLPRHIKRANGLIKSLTKYQLKITLYSKTKNIDKTLDIYLVDEMNKAGLFCKFASLVYIGKSMFIEYKGGHNLLEPMSLGKPVIFGRFMDNFREIANTATHNLAAVEAASPLTLQEEIERLLKNKELLKSMGENALKLAKAKAEVKNKIMLAVEGYLWPTL